MAIRFRSLPLEVFPKEAQPYIGHLNVVLKDLTGLEGTIRQQRKSNRSDSSIARGEALQVHVSRITPSIDNVVSGVSTVVGAPALTLGTANSVGSTTTAISINSTIALFDTTAAGALGSTAATGSVAFAARRDHQHIYPTTVQSAANASTLVLTDDATDQTLTASLGLLNIIPGTGININFPDSAAAQLIIKPNTTTAAATVISVQMRPAAGTRTGMAPNVFSPVSGDTFSNQTFKCWDSNMPSFAGQYTGCSFVAYDISNMTMLPSSGSSNNNYLYGIRSSTFQINNANASWAEVATAMFKGVRRLLTSPKIDTQATVIIEPPTGASTTQAGAATAQIGLLIRQQTAQVTAANRYGIQIDAQNSGTNRRAIYTADAIENSTTDFICSTTAKGLISKDAQATPRYWRVYSDAVEGTTGGATFSIDNAGVMTVTRATGATGTLRFQMVDVGTAAPTT